MKKFEPPQSIISILGAYPDAELIASAVKTGGRKSKVAIARLWLSEGIPFIFKDCPAIYETIREWLASRLQIDAKEISLTGSARLGQSLVPQKLGKAFSENSDLDLFVVSESLFLRMNTDFNKFSRDLESEKIKPNTRKQERLWNANLNENPDRIRRGFIDSTSIPSMPEYETIYEMSNTLWLLKEKLDVTDNAPKISKASIRCYKNWSDCVNQIAISL